MNASNTLPICVNCQHHTVVKHPLFRERCASPEHGVDLVQGLPILPACEQQRSSHSALACGQSGRLFVAKPSVDDNGLPPNTEAPTQAQALLRRGRSGIAGTAFTNNAAALEFWKGYTEAARDLIHGIGALAEAKDELASGDPQTSLQAAGACLPERTKGLTLAQVRQLLTAQGFEVTMDAITHTDLRAGEVLEHNVVPRVDGDDEHPVARVHMRHCSDGHGLSSPNQSEASLDHSEPRTPVAQEGGAA